MSHNRRELSKRSCPLPPIQTSRSVSDVVVYGCLLKRSFKDPAVYPWSTERIYPSVSNVQDNSTLTIKVELPIVYPTLQLCTPEFSYQSLSLTFPQMSLCILTTWTPSTRLLPPLVLPNELVGHHPHTLNPRLKDSIITKAVM